jgi:hypothetical protein
VRIVTITTGAEMDRPGSKDEVQDERLDALERVPVRHGDRAMSRSEGQGHADLQDAQTRVLVQGQHQIAQQIAELTISQQNAIAWRAASDARLKALELALADNTQVTMDVRDLLDAFKGGFKVLGWLGTATKWLGAIAAAGMALYTALYMVTHGGNLPGGK